MTPRGQVAVVVTGDVRDLVAATREGEHALGGLGTASEHTGSQAGMLNKLLGGSGLAHVAGEAGSEVKGLAEKAAGQLSPALGSAVGQVTSITGKLGGAQTALLGVGGGAVAAGAAIGEMALHGVKDLVDLAGEVRTVQRVTGATAEESSKLNVIFKMTGVNAQQGANAFFLLSKNIEKNEAKLKSHGIEVARDDKGEVDLVKTLESVSEAYHRAGTGAEGNAVAAAAFGKAGQTLLPILSANTDQLEEFVKAGEKHHEILSQDDLDKAKQYKIATKELGEAFSGVERELGEKLIPILTGAAEKITAVVDGIDHANVSVGGFGDAAKRQGGVLQVFAGIVDLVSKKHDEGAKSVEHMTTAHGDLDATIRHGSVTAFDHAAAVTEDAAAVEKNKAETETLVSVIDAATEALDSYDRALDETFGATIDVQKAHIETAQAIEDLGKQVHDGQQKDETARQAKDRLALAAGDVANRIADEVDAMAKSGEIADTAKSKNDALIYKLEQLKGKYPELASQIDVFLYAAKAAADQTGPAGARAASDFIDGIVNTFRDREGEIVVTADHAARVIETAMRAAHDSHSPSRVAVKIATDFNAGIIKGLQDTSADVGAAAAMVAQHVIDSVERGMNVARSGVSQQDARAALVGDRATVSHLEEEKRALPGRLADASKTLRDLQAQQARFPVGTFPELDRRVEAAKAALAHFEEMSTTIGADLAAARKKEADDAMAALEAHQAAADARQSFGELGPGAVANVRHEADEAGLTASETNQLLARILGALDRPVQVVVDGAALARAVTPHVRTELIKVGKANGGSALGGYG